MNARLYVVGTGPGDPGLLTLKGLAAIQSATLVAYLAANDALSIARAIVAEHLRPEQRELVIRLPMTEPREAAIRAYDQGAVDIRLALEAGETVTLLCEGDPLFYGSAVYLLERLADWPEIEVIPGVCSPLAAMAACRAPLAMQGQPLHVLPASLDPVALRARLTEDAGVVVMKLGRHVGAVRAAFDETGRLANAWYVGRLGMPREQLLRLTDFDEPSAPYFSLALSPAPSGVPRG